jgi:rhodanese-related sulfurtransferase
MRVDTLRSLLEQGHPITILDVRPEPERQDWAIPNSLFSPGCTKQSTRAMSRHLMPSLYPLTN